MIGQFSYSHGGTIVLVNLKVALICTVDATSVGCGCGTDELI